MWWMLLATASAGVGPFSVPEPKTRVFGTEPQAVEDKADQGQVKILMAGREGDVLKIDGWPFGNLPVETELAAGLHKFRVEGEAGVVELDAVVHVSASSVTEIDLAVAQAPPETVQPTSVQGNKPQLAAPSEARPDADEPEEPEAEPAPAAASTDAP